jgi:type I restriction enzyme, S subunit
MIPDGWNTQKLEEVSIGILDCHHSTPEWTDSGYIVLRTNNIRNGVLDFSSVSFTNELNYHERVKRAIPEEGDIVVTREAPAGEVALIPSNLKVCLGQRLVLVKLKHNLVSASYIKFYLMSDLVQRNVFQLQANGSTVGNIRIPVLKSINLLLPPLLEQCRIAEVLGVWDESIDLLERLIGRVRSRKQGLMQQLLTGKKRFKEFEGSEWKTVNLSDLCSLITKGTTPSSIGFEFCNEGINYIKIESINDRGQFLTEKIAKISEEAYQALKRSQLRELDILFSIAGALGRVAIVNNNILPANTNQALAIIRLKEEYRNCHEYLFQYLKSDVITKHIECVNVQAAQANLSLSQINNFKIIFPSIPEQEKIAAVLSAADEEISTLEKQLAAYKQQKLGLMQQLLTGSIRI